MHGPRSGRVSWSSAGYQAKTPFGDINIQQVSWCGDMPCALLHSPVSFWIVCISSQQSLRGGSVYWFGVVNVADGVPVSTVVVGLGFHLIHFRR